MVNLLKITLEVKQYLAKIQRRARIWQLLQIGWKLEKTPNCCILLRPVNRPLTYTPQPQIIFPFQPDTQRYGAEIGQDAMAWPTANIKTTAASAFFMVIPFTCGYFSTAKIQAVW